MNDAEVEPGYWLSQWTPMRDGNAIFTFGADLGFCFNEESYARNVAADLRESEIETKVVEQH